MKETAHLLSTRANTQRLMESIAQDRASEMVVSQIAQDDELPVSNVSKKSLLGKKAPRRTK